MEHFFNRVWDDLLGRIGGPLHLRVILQPVMASVLAIRAGLRKGREMKSSHCALAFHSDERTNLLGSGMKDIAGVLVFALILDLIYQLIALHTVYLGEAIFVAVVLAIIPYLLVRPLVTWLIRKKGGNYEKRRD
jgi:hypothetical protein